MTAANRWLSLGMWSGLLIVALGTAELLAPATAKANTDPSTPWIWYDGQYGENVWCIQFILVNFANHGHIDIDRTYGPETRQGVLDVQRLFQLQMDGVVGPQTGEAFKFILESKAGAGSFGTCQDLVPTLS